MWQLVQANGENADFNCNISPTARTKHATCTNQDDGFIYLYGGKSGNMSLKDLWRFDTENNYWEEIKCSGDQPPSLQEHTMIAWSNKIFIFGGEIGYSSQDTPLWQLNLDSWTWYKFGSVNTNSPGISSTQPTGRSGHSAVLFENAIYIYGGYQQLKGSLSELWKFDLCNESWSLISGPCISTLQPLARHYHSAVIYGNQMYVYGGMHNLESKSDFWRWNLIDKTWTKIKCNRGPGELYGHSAIKAFDCMFIFGGERNGNLLQELWRFNFDTECWDKIQTSGMLPSPRSRHTAISNPFIELLASHNNWDQQTDASSSISSNNSNQSDSNRLSQYNYDLSDNNNGACRKDKLSSKSSSSSHTKQKLDDDTKNKENKCDCNRSNESTIRKFFRKKIVKNKLVRSMSTNSYNISHNENCNLYRTNQNANQTMKKSNTYYENTMKANQKTDNCLVNSNTIENLSISTTTTTNRNQQQQQQQQDRTSISNSSQLDEKKNDKNKLNNNEQTATATTNKQTDTIIGKTKQLQDNQFRIYDIGGQLSSCLNSPGEETEDLDLFDKINQLQKELDCKTHGSSKAAANLTATDISTNKTLNNNRKQRERPKSDLILAHFHQENDEEMKFEWDVSDLNRSVDEFKDSYYTISFPSPQSFPNKFNTTTNSTGDAATATSFTMTNKSSNYYSLAKMRSRVSNDLNRKARPKTYHPHYIGYNDNDAISSYFESNLHGIKELESLNDDQFITEEEMISDGKESPTKSEGDTLEISELDKLNDLNELNESEKNQIKSINQTGNSSLASHSSSSSCYGQKTISPTKTTNNHQSPSTINNNNNSNNNNTTASNTTTICSPMSTSSVFLSSGYQSLMEDNITDNNLTTIANLTTTSTIVESNDTTNHHQHHHQITNNNQVILNQLTSTDQISNNQQSIVSNSIKLRNRQSVQLIKNHPPHHPNSKRYSCNLSSFGSSYEQAIAADKFMIDQMMNKENDNNQINEKKINQNDDLIKTTSTTTTSATYKQHPPVKQLIPNSTSNVEISLTNNKQNWENVKMVKTFSTSAFNGKDTIFNNKTNSTVVQQRNSNSFLNLSEKVNIGSLDFLMIKKRKDKKKKKDYQFCMLVFGGNEKSHDSVFSKQPISVYKLYI